jgi:hypothetical protein
MAVLVIVAVVAFAVSVWVGTMAQAPILQTFSCPVYQPPATQIPQAHENCK